VIEGSCGAETLSTAPSMSALWETSAVSNEAPKDVHTGKFSFAARDQLKTYHLLSEPFL
jgi:hypothetical protein